MESPSVENRDHPGPGDREPTASPDSNSSVEKRRIFFETASLAEVYVQQGHISHALEIYRRMQKRDASDQRLAQRISELECRLRSRRPVRPKDRKQQNPEEG